MTRKDVRIYGFDRSVVIDLTKLNGNLKVFIFDALGSKVRIRQTSGNEVLTIPLSPAGIYLVKVEHERKIFSEKVIVL